jgi:hypothetical protein
MPDQVVTRHLDNADQIIQDAMDQDQAGNHSQTARLLADALKTVILAVRQQNEAH